MRPKDKLADGEKSSVIYQINCNDCSKNYVGETSKRLKSRIHEHELCVKRKDILSLVAQHGCENNHTFNFSEAKVIGTAKSKSSRLLKESWLTNENSINRHVNLDPAYQALRHQLSQKDDTLGPNNMHQNFNLGPNTTIGDQMIFSNNYDSKIIVATQTDVTDQNEESNFRQNEPGPSTRFGIGTKTGVSTRRGGAEQVTS
jgi:hypothetical protein